MFPVSVSLFSNLYQANGCRMNSFLGLFFLLVDFILLGRCLTDREELCSSLKEDGFLGNVTSSSQLKVTLHHKFLLTEKGIIPGLKYNVTLLRTVGEGSMDFVLTSDPMGRFEPSASGVTTCDSFEDVVGTLAQELTFMFTSPLVLNDSLIFTLSTRTVENSQWSTSLVRFRVRPDCFYVLPKDDLVITSEDVAHQPAKTVLIHSPLTSGLQVNLEDVLIPDDGAMFIYNTTESSVALILSYSDSEQRSYLTLADQFLLLDITRCFNCRFRLVIKPIATSYECNSTLRIAQGSLELVKLSPPTQCELQLQAPPFHRILVRVLDQLPAPSKKCNQRKLHLGPLAGIANQKTWTPCANLSQAQTEFYISESNILEVNWDGTLQGVLLNYEFFPLCSNKSFGESPIGQFCSTGYPDILFECNTVYSIYVPFGYSIELKLSVLGVTAGAFCDNNTLDVTTRNASKEEKLLLELCFDEAADRKELFTLRIPGNNVDIRIHTSSDLLRKGFCATYKALPSDLSYVEDCPYGWVSGQKFCYKVYNQRLKWVEAEDACRMRNGHLASITDNRIALLIDDIIKNSPIYSRNNAIWIGANDLRYENCYEWTDGQPFDFFFWFPGWENYGWYSVQPSDDGLSQQNCVELRNVFRYPSKGEGSTERFFWNDRDCQVENFFVCQRLKPGVTLDPVTTPACNRTITLNWEHPREMLVSPGFPNNYPNNIKCHYYITAPHGQRIVALFTDFVLEESESCEYDDLTLIEDGTTWRRCGDWENKIKLLRHISLENSFHLIFSSDFSHSYKGFRIELTLLTERTQQSTLCDNDMFQLKNGQCYLVVNYPETSWTTARQICSEAKAKLAIVENAEQVAVLDELVRSTYGYMSGVVFWVGAHASAGNSTWKWLDGTTMSSKLDLRISKADNSPSPACLAIQWKQLRSSNALRWTAKNCNHPGRFICQKPSVVMPEELNKTVSQLRGNLTSVNYPSNYLNDLDYIAEIIGPPKSRVVLTFHSFDLEWQEDCLYDFILLRSNLNEDGLKLCGEHLSDSEFMSTTNKAYLSFHSDFSNTASGYSVSWEIVDLSVCLNRRLLILEPTYITSLRYPRAYLTGLDCHITVIASEPTKRLLLTINDLDLRSCADDFLEVNLDPIDEKKKIRLCGDDLLPGTQFMAYGNEAQFFFNTIEGNTMRSLENRGYNITCETWGGTTLENTVYINSAKKGHIHSMNFNHKQPIGLNYSQRVMAPVGHKIHLRFFNMSYASSQLTITCEGSGLLIRDNYASQKTLMLWNPCRSTNFEEVDGFWSTLHVLNIDAWNFDGSLPSYSLEYSVVKDDHFLNTTLTLASDAVESCRPNPCQHGGRCIRNGTNYRCHCFGQYTGLFCHLTWCDVNVCGENGSCNLTSSGWTCDCFPGFSGPRCQQTITPCSPNPCGENGVCSPRNATFHCQCALDYEGSHCEKLVMRIPYKPLSQRMLEEPFWLGLITVFSVLLIILCVYCIKRKFADKIEKFLAEEIERSKYQPSPPATRYSLSSTQPSLTPGNQSPQTNPKSLFNRIRKNSLLGAACSPSPTPDRDTSRTFSFDDILRRVHSSKRNRSSSNNPSCSGAGSSGANLGELSREEAVKKEEEKSRILASLVAPQKEAASRRMSLDEFFRMNEQKLSARRTNSTAGSTDCEGGRTETSFISMPSPKTLRQSFSEIQSIQEQSFEYMSSSESMNGEPSTSEIQADVSPTPPYYKKFKREDSQPDIDTIDKSPEHSSIQTHSNTASPTPTERANPPSISITIDKCDSDSKPDCDSDEKNCDSDPKSNTCDNFTVLSPNISRNSSYLEVPQTIPAIKVFSAESDEPQSASETTSNNSVQDRSEQSSPCRKDFTQQRKYSVDLPMPKILITANMGSCDSDEASPPRTPNPNKSMIYLSPLAVISSSTDRTISESNLSTSGYSSISSPGLSRCNSSSPISDEVEHHHHPNCSHHKAELLSPKKPHGVQMTYLSVGGNDKTFFFPQASLACHCHSPNQASPVIFEPKSSPTVSTVWTPGKQRLLCKRNSYQTTSTDDSIDDEGIGLDTNEFKIRKGEVRNSWDVNMFVSGEQTSAQMTASPLLMEPSKPDLLACSVNSRTGSGSSFKGSPRSGMRKSDKPKKYSDKHRRSPVLSPASTPVKDHNENAEVRLPRNSSRTSMSGPLMSTSESDDSEVYLGARQKSQARRSKKPHEPVTGAHKQPFMSMPSQDSSGPRTDKSSDATGRSSPLSESNGDSAPMDSRSPASSSSESLSSTKDSTMSEKVVYNRHKSALEHTRSFPPLSQCARHSSSEDGKGTTPKIKMDLKKIKLPVIQIDSEEEVVRSSEDHPCLRRQEAIVEDDPSDDSSSETTVLLGRQTESPRNLQQSSSADVSEWEAFNKD